MKTKNLTFYIIIFLILNFLGLAIGGLSTNSGIQSDWYLQANKAPWTPPGWVFGFAWTTIMILFSIYWAYVLIATENKTKAWTLFGIVWFLNVIWNPIFFTWHITWLGLVVISLLFLGLAYLFKQYKPLLQAKSYLLVPYLLWLLIAWSLNAYLVF